MNRDSDLEESFIVNQRQLEISRSKLLERKAMNNEGRELENNSQLRSENASKQNNSLTPSQAIENFTSDTDNADIQIVLENQRLSYKQEAEKMQKLQQKIRNYESQASAGRVSMYQNQNLNIRRTFLDHIPILEPEALFLLFFEIVIFAIMIVFFFEVPLEILVWNKIKSLKFSSKGFLYGFGYFATPVLAFDLILYFSVAFYVEGNVVRDRRLIALNYIKWRFWMSLLAFLGAIYDLFINDTTVIYLSLFIFLRLYSMLQIDTRIKRELSFYPWATAVYKIFSLFLIIFFVAHIYSCVFMGISVYLITDENYAEGNAWMNSYDLYTSYPPQSETGAPLSVYGALTEQDQWELAYMYGLYWAVSNMITLGSDIVPLNPWEVGMQLISEFIGVIIYAYIINFIFAVLQQVYSQQTMHRDELRAIKVYMREKQVPQELSGRVEMYLNYKWQKECLRDKELEVQVLGQLPPYLRLEVLQISVGRFLDSIHWIKQNFSETFFARLLELVEEIDLPMYHTIDQRDGVALYQLLSGEVYSYFQIELKQKKREINVQNVKVNDVWGDEFFITGQPGNLLYKAKTFSKVLKLSRANFLKALENLNDDMEIFNEIRDKVHIERQKLG